MDIETFRNYCVIKKGVTEEFPFDADTLVFKVMGKMFALVSLEKKPSSANLKCDPEWSLELRDTYDGDIFPGYHMSKKHWNTVLLESRLPPRFIQQLVDHSYDLVVAGLTKKLKAELDSLQ
ncbi:MmcQ/YjbR family DNA-binding protein [Flavobacteriaceae bacterium F89]|uniref:MmcQ/YjbR family DNA-binding protein n=1 Tax=Cerina litoralis TaxID=2874477 RepID=A0AAE3EYE5_9FLAO|nr:MmcQ/YjbR family DNA-binding protein [Cerina litoralis]MCG2462649.1 MmcQ/YjbR family DNA-binding protein [Cerina litoralis]